jgi:hypothetical protein
VQFERNYDKEPNIIITASHNSSGNNLEPTYMSVAAWIEVGITNFQWVMKGCIYTCQMSVKNGGLLVLKLLGPILKWELGYM